VFYTLKGKNVVLIDVFCIAAGFALRVMGGSYAIKVVPSGWLITSTFFLSLFLGFSKRKAELVSLNGEDCAGRPSLQFYDFNLLTNVIVSTRTGAIVFYTLYTLDVRTVQQFGTDKLYLTVPFVVCFAVAFVLYAVSLTKLKLSVAYPIMTSAGFILASLFSHFLFKESVTVTKIIGMVVIVTGIWLVSI
jgi:multidrug transporter EmrE-like cation transporter